MVKLVITRGVPASGKSTFAKQWVKDGERRVRINRDDLRHQLYDSYWGSDVDEMAVTAAQDGMLRSFLKNGYDVVLDNTNLRARNVKDTLKIAAEFGAEVEFKDFPITREEAHRRNAERSRRGERAVPMDAINGFFTKFIGKNGAFPPVPELTVNTFAEYVPDPSLPDAILVDIDGTLAHMSGRSPYDKTLYHTDTVDEVVAHITQTYLDYGYRIIIFSARGDGGRAVTEKWLDDHDIDYHEFFMRKEGDERNDAVVKNEMFEEHILGKYNVKFILDDRDRVVNMWRAKGMKVLQVADGNF